MRLVYVNTFSVYGQDSYKLTKKLSVNYGMRYDYEGPVHTGQPNLSIFDPSFTTGRPGLAVAGQTWPISIPGSGTDGARVSASLIRSARAARPCCAAATESITTPST